MAIYTAGHSILSEEKFLDMVKDMDTVVDVRSHPTSRYEQFQKDKMEKWVTAAGKQYVWAPGLGGWTGEHKQYAKEMEKEGVDISPYLGSKGKFPKQHIAKKLKPTDDKPIWTSRGFADYEWFMTTPEFKKAAQELVDMGKKKDVVIICAEALYYKCHRSLISDYLLYKYGVNSHHLISGGKPVSHDHVLGNRLDRYQPKVIKSWGPATDKPIGYFTDPGGTVHPIEVSEHKKG